MHIGVFPNGCVDGDDWLAVVAQWGACEIGVICTADVDGNCSVDGDDLLAVNAAWGCSPCEESFLGGDPPSIEEQIAMVLASDASEAVKAEIIEFLLSNSN
jgi:hypothetical protein